MRFSRYPARRLLARVMLGCLLLGPATAQTPSPVSVQTVAFTQGFYPRALSVRIAGAGWDRPLEMAVGEGLVAQRRCLDRRWNPTAVSPAIALPLFPFGETLPYGPYQVNVDVVAEVAATNTIHGAHLTTADKLRCSRANEKRG